MKTEKKKRYYKPVRIHWLFKTAILITIYISGLWCLSILTNVGLIDVLTRQGMIDTETKLVTAAGVNIVTCVHLVVQSLIMIGVPLLLWKLFDHLKFSEMGLRSLKRHKSDALVGLALGSIVMGVIFIGLVSTGKVEFLGFNKKGFLNILLGFGLFALIALAEEIFFRGYIISIMKKTKNMNLCLIMSAVFYVLINLGNKQLTIASIINLFMLGGMLSYMYMRSGNLWMPIFFQFGWSFFESTIFGLPSKGFSIPGLVNMSYETNIYNGGGFGPEGGIAVTMALMLCFLVVDYYFRNTEIDFFTYTEAIPEKKVKA